MERCLACEAVVSRDISPRNALFRAALYRLEIKGPRPGNTCRGTRRKGPYSQCRDAKCRQREVLRDASHPVHHGLASEATLHGFAFAEPTAGQVPTESALALINSQYATAGYRY